MNKLYSLEQVQEWATKRADDAGRLSRQLLDTMRENEAMKKEVSAYQNKAEYYELLCKHITKACDKLNPNKESAICKESLQVQSNKHSADWDCEHGIPHKQCGSCYNQKKPPTVDGINGPYQLPYTKT